LTLLPASVTAAYNAPDIPPIPSRAQKTVLPMPKPATAPLQIALCLFCNIAQFFY
jgi:hypothetical protein